MEEIVPQDVISPASYDHIKRKLNESIDRTRHFCYLGTDVPAGITLGYTLTSQDWQSPSHKQSAQPSSLSCENHTQEK